MSYYGSFVLQCYVLRKRVMTSTVGGNLANRPPALRHIHVKNVPNFWDNIDFCLRSFDPRQEACPLGLCQGCSRHCNAAFKCLIGTLSFVVCLSASLLRSFRSPRVHFCLAGSKFMPLLGHFKHLTFGRIMWPCWFGLPLLRCGCNTMVSWDLPTQSPPCFMPAISTENNLNGSCTYRCKQEITCLLLWWTL